METTGVDLSEPRINPHLDDVTTPFTPEQVAVLNRFQASQYMHPFTCGKRSEHRDNEGILIATEEGWRCPVETCDYTQDWAHWFMADVGMVEQGEERQRELWGLDEPCGN